MLYLVEYGPASHPSFSKNTVFLYCCLPHVFDIFMKITVSKNLVYFLHRTKENVCKHKGSIIFKQDLLFVRDFRDTLYIQAAQKNLPIFP